ncbi:cytochrome P450 [Nodularia chucula]|uniref:cytochrome P450 n=1 Tax=Nodularia chucula TaxID=3093667 RepID=UPI0039C5D707
MQPDHQSAMTEQNSVLIGNPFPWYDQMRRDSPVFYDAEQQSWMVFRYEDIKRVCTDWQTFSSQVPQPSEQVDLTQSLNYTDPPKHQSLRSLVAKVFTARRVAELAPRITQITHELIDKVQGKNRIDFVQDLAIPLPVIVIAEILGVPVEDRADFKHWSNGIILSDPTALQYMGDYFRHLLEQRRQNSGKDLISDLIAAHEAGETLTAQELVDFCILMLVAGNETTTNLLGNTLLCFKEYPEAFKRLKREPELLPLAIEEVLRYHSPLQGTERFTKVATQLGGKTIPAGQMVLVWIGAGNRDETQFDRPDEFVIDRNPNPHLSFGNGIHFCLGAPLARLESKIMLSAMLERLPNIHIEPNATLEFIPSMAMYGVKSLSVLL